MNERLPVQDWTMEMASGKIILGAEVTDTGFRHYRAFNVTPSDAADNGVGLKDLEGIHFIVADVDVSAT